MIRKSKVFFVLLNFLGVQSTHDIWINFREQDLHRTMFRFFASLSKSNQFLSDLFFRTSSKAIFLVELDMDQTLLVIRLIQMR